MKSAGDGRQEIAISSSSYIPKPQVVRRVCRKPLGAGHFGEDSLPVLCSPGDSGDSSAACERSRLCRWGVKVPALGAVPRADAMSQCMLPSSCPVTSVIAQALPGQPVHLHPHQRSLTHSFSPRHLLLALRKHGRLCSSAFGPPALGPGLPALHLWPPWSRALLGQTLPFSA